MGFSLSATTSLFCVTLLVMLEIFSGALIPKFTDITDAYDGLKDRAIDQLETDITITGTSDGGWWNPGWLYRKTIIVNHSQVAGDLTDFPVLINITDDEDLAAYAQPDGDDIVFISYDNTTRYNHEIEYYYVDGGHDPPIASLIAWVRVPLLRSDVDTVFYMYYGNATCGSQQNMTGTWNSEFKMVQHLEEIDAVSVTDSTSYGNNGEINGGVTPGVTGNIDGMFQFDGVSTDYVNFGNDTSLAPSEITLEAWVKDPPKQSSTSSESTVAILNKHSETVTINPGKEFNIQRVISAGKNKTVVFIALCSPGVLINDMRIKESSVMYRSYQAGLPRSSNELSIEYYRRQLPEQVQQLGTLVYSQPLILTNGSAKVELCVSLSPWCPPLAERRISYLLLASDGSYDVECTTHIVTQPVFFNWFDPFSVVKLLINFFFGGESTQQKKEETTVSQGKSEHVITTIQRINDRSFLSPYWAFYNAHTSWDLEVYNVSIGKWMSVTQYLHILSNYSTNNTCKLTLDFTAPLTGDYRVTFRLNSPVTSFTFVPTVNTYILSFENETSGFTVSFNFSDIASFPDLMINHNVTDNLFWLRVQKNAIPKGFHVWLDPTSTITTDPSALLQNTQRKLVRTSDGALHCVFSKVNDDGIENIVYAKSTNNGTTWTLTNLTVDSAYNQYHPSIATDSNNRLYVVWDGTISGIPIVSRIRYKIHNGFTWGPIVNLTTGNYNQYYPAVAVNSTNIVHVVWYGQHAGSTTYYQIRYSKYNGIVWSAPINLTAEGSAHEQYPSLAIDSTDVIHVVWQGACTGMSLTQIRYRSCINGNWGTTITNITRTGSYTQLNPCIAIDSGNSCHVVWRGLHAGSGSNYQIRYSNTLSKSWTTPINLTTDTSYQQGNPSITIDANNYLYVIWAGIHAGSSGLYWIRCRAYKVGSWTTTVDLVTGNTGARENPNTIWALHPTISGLKTCRPKLEYAFIYNVDDTTDSLMYYNSSRLAWDTLKVAPTQALPFPVNQSMGVNRTPLLKITVNDTNYDCLSIKWRSNSSGSWKQFGSVTSSSTTNKFGYMTAGTNYCELDDVIRGSNFTCPANGTATSLTAYLDIQADVANQVSLKGAIYYSSNDSFLAETQEQIYEISQSTQWITFSFSTPPTLHAGIDYYLVFWADVPSDVYARLYYNTVPVSYNLRGAYEVEAYGNFPGTLNPTKENKGYSIYCTYTSYCLTSDRFYMNNMNFSRYSTKYYWSVNATDGNVWTNRTYYFTTENDTVPPDISYIDPTPYNDTHRNITLFNVSLSTYDDNTRHYSFVDFNQSLHLWMRMDDTDDAGNPEDLSSYENHGTKQGEARQTDNGYYGKDFSFDGTGDYIQVPNLNNGAQGYEKTNFTISLWIKTSTINKCLISDWYDVVLGSYGWTLSTNGLGQLEYTQGSGASIPTSITGTATVTTGSWFHVVVADRGATAITDKNTTIYLNGAVDKDASRGARFTSSNRRFTIGSKYTSTGYTSDFNGDIDEVLLFNRSLNLTEIKALYNASANQYQNNFTNLTDRRYNVTGYAVDRAGNKNQTETRNITIDTIKPMIEFIPPTPSSGVYHNPYIVVNVSSNDTNPHYVITDFNRSLLLWMRMDDLNLTGHPTDISTYQNNGTKQGDATQTNNGYYGKDFTFDGTGDYIQIPTLNNGGGGYDSHNLSISLWFKTSTTDQCLISDYYNTKPYGGWHLGITASGYLVYIIGSSGIYEGIYGNTQVNTSQWYHVVVVDRGQTSITGDNTTIYLNGALDGDWTRLPKSTSTNRRFTIGSLYSSAGYRKNFSGDIDEVLAFNRSLNETEIEALYNAKVNQYSNNFTDLQDGASYTFTSYAVDRAGNMNETEERNVSIDTPKKEIFAMKENPYGLKISLAGDICYGYINNTRVNTSIDTDWHYVVLTYDGSIIRLYKDGELVDTVSYTKGITYPSPLPNLTVGRNLSGWLDELRISNTSRSTEWINTSYNSMNSPETFYEIEDSQTKAPFMHINITVTNTGSTELETADFTILFNGTKVTYTTQNSYIYPQNETIFTVNVTSFIRRRIKVITENGIADYEEYYGRS